MAQSVYPRYATDKNNIYRSKYGAIPIAPVNMDHIREVNLPDWESKNPQPIPPKTKPEYMRENASEMIAIKDELGLSRAKAIEEWQNRQESVPDLMDKNYLSEMKLWQNRRNTYFATIVCLYGICNDDGKRLVEMLIDKDVDGQLSEVYAKIKADGKEFGILFERIVEISELTQSLVIKKIKELGYLWNGVCIIEASKSLEKGNVASNWKSMGYVAGKEVESIGPVKFRQLSIEEQAEIVAIHLTSTWVTALQHEENKRKMENERNKRTKK